MSEVNNIPEGWVETTIGKVGKVITGKTPSKDNPEDWGNLVDFITPTEIKSDNKFIFNCPRKLSVKGIERFSKMILPEKSVIVTCIGSDMGKVVLNKTKALANQQINSIIVNEKNYSDFIYYLLKDSYKILRKKAEGSGSTMPILNKSTFENLEFYIPKNINEQKSIAAILTAFDDKIELLQAQNKTLEELAKTIFAAWFGKYQIGDELPDGWRVGKLEEVIEFINGYAFKSNDLLNEPEIETLKVFKMGDIKKGGGFNPSKTKSYFRKKDAKKLSKYILRNGDLLMCMTDMKDAISLLGHTALMIYDDEYIVNQRVGLIRAKNDINISYPYLYLLTNEANFISDLRGRSNSGVQVNLSTEAIKQSNIVIADKDTNLKFNIIVKPLFDKVKTNTEQIQTLTQTRDTLLPQLMSGAVRVQV